MSLTLHFTSLLPAFDPIERLWGVMHKHLTHNKSYATYREFAEAALNFLGEKVTKNWPKFRDWSPITFASSTQRTFGFWSCLSSRLSAWTTTSASANSPSNW